MHRLPISFPSKVAPSSPVVDLARSLQAHPYAVALATMGYRITTDALTGDFGSEVTWWVEDRQSDAQALCVRYDASGAVPLLADPPAGWEFFCACMAGLSAYAALASWAVLQADPPSWEKRMSFLWPTTGAQIIRAEKPTSGIDSLPVAAALAACGFLPAPQLFSGPSGFPAWGFPENSVTFPGLQLTPLMAAIQRPAEGIVEPIRLPGYPPEEHPFLYALQACLNMPGFLEARRAAEAAPRLAFRSKFSERSAIVSADTLREGRKDTAQFRDRLLRHLSS